MPASGVRSRPGTVTQLLGRLQAGDRTTLTPLLELVYPELRRLARGLLRHEAPGHVLQPTALVNEAYLRLVAHEEQNWENRAHFFGAVARLMRRILVDYARTGSAKKRDQSRAIAPDGGRTTVQAPPIDIIGLDLALDELDQIAPRQARIVELRYFVGLSVPEIAEALGLNARTVDRDWAAARAWLRRRLEP